MAKILYIEDDLKAEDICNLFYHWLSKDEEKKLLNAFGREEIKACLASNQFVQVEYNFLEAIKLVQKNLGAYSVYIVDRNLSDGYKKADLPDHLKNKFVDGQEGDYLLDLLIQKFMRHANLGQLLDRFFFLTAYPKEKIAVEESLGLLHSFFPASHIIPKTHESEEDGYSRKFLIDEVINNHIDLCIKSKHFNAFKVFSHDFLPAENETSLLSVLRSLESREQDVIREKVVCLRTLFESSLDLLAESFPEIFKSVPSAGGRVPAILKTLNGSPENVGPKNRQVFKPTTKEYFSEVLFLFCKNAFWSAASNLHHSKKTVRKQEYVPTQNTLPILTYIFLDYLEWLDCFLSENKTCLAKK